MAGCLDGITAYKETSCKGAETSVEPHRIFFYLKELRRKFILETRKEAIAWYLDFPF